MPTLLLAFRSRQTLNLSAFEYVHCIERRVHEETAVQRNSHDAPRGNCRLLLPSLFVDFHYEEHGTVLSVLLLREKEKQCVPFRE